MSLNRLSVNVDRGVDLDLQIGCTALKVGDIFWDGKEGGNESDLLECDGAGNLSLVEVFKKRRAWMRSLESSYNINVQLFSFGYLPISINKSAWELSDFYYALAADGIKVTKNGRYQIILNMEFSTVTQPCTIGIGTMINNAKISGMALQTVVTNSVSDVCGVSISDERDLFTDDVVKICGASSPASSLFIQSWNISLFFVS